MTDPNGVSLRDLLETRLGDNTALTRSGLNSQSCNLQISALACLTLVSNFSSGRKRVFLKGRSLVPPVPDNIPDHIKPEHGRKQISDDTQCRITEKVRLDAGGDDQR